MATEMIARSAARLEKMPYQSNDPGRHHYSGVSKHAGT